jgi:hypothetical protein
VFHRAGFRLLIGTRRNLNAVGIKRNGSQAFGRTQRDRKATLGLNRRHEALGHKRVEDKRQEQQRKDC